MQFVVPQFLDVETKIIGPISARQFIIILVTFAIMFLWYQLFSVVLFLVLSFFTATIGGAFAFARINGQAMHYFVLNLIETFKRPRLKYWQRMEYQKAEKEEAIIVAVPRVVKDMSQSRLASMSLMVDTGGAYAPTDISQMPAKKGKEVHKELSTPAPNSSISSPPR